MVKFSVEILPPRSKEKIIPFIETAKHFIDLNFEFISVTYGSNNQDGLFGSKIVGTLIEGTKTKFVQHLTYINKTKAEIDQLLNELINNNCQNVLALRGDGPDLGATYFQSTAQFITYIKEKYPQIEVGVALFPEGNQAINQSINDEIENVKQKIQAGATYGITQICYHSEKILEYLKLLRENDLKIEVLPGIITTYSVNRYQFIEENMKVPAPQEHLKKLNAHPDKKQIELKFWSKYIEELKNHVPSFHFFSFNHIGSIKDLVHQINKSD